MASAAPTDPELPCPPNFDRSIAFRLKVLGGFKTIRKEYVYPHEVDGKPQLSVPVYRPDSEKALVITKEELDAVTAEFHLGTHLEMICSFLYKMMHQFTGVETNANGWHSYKVEIAKPQTVVSINQLLNIKEEPFWTGDDKTTYTAAPAGHHLQTLVAKCLIPYRMNRSSSTTYLSSVQRRLCAIYSVPPYKSISMKGLTSVASWSNYKVYCKIAAAYDQFFVHFETHEYASLRECTRDASMKGCAVLRSIETAAKCLNITDTELYTYNFYRQLHVCIQRVMKNAEKEEIGVKDSYFPYAIEYGMIPRSPYGASAGPELYMFNHMIGSLHSVVASVNAKRFDTGDIFQLFKNAIHVSYYLGGGTSVELQSMLSKDEAERQHNDKDSNKKQAFEYHTTDPEQILQRMNENRYKIPDFMKKRFLSAASVLIHSRPGTVGELVASALEIEIRSKQR